MQVAGYEGGGIVPKRETAGRDAQPLHTEDLTALGRALIPGEEHVASAEVFQ